MFAKRMEDIFSLNKKDRKPEYVNDAKIKFTADKPLIDPVDVNNVNLTHVKNTITVDKPQKPLSKRIASLVYRTILKSVLLGLMITPMYMLYQYVSNEHIFLGTKYSMELFGFVIGSFLTATGLKTLNFRFSTAMLGFFLLSGASIHVLDRLKTTPNVYYQINEYTQNSLQNNHFLISMQNRDENFIGPDSANDSLILNPNGKLEIVTKYNAYSQNIRTTLRQSNAYNLKASSLSWNFNALGEICIDRVGCFYLDQKSGRLTQDGKYFGKIELVAAPQVQFESNQISNYR